MAGVGGGQCHWRLEQPAMAGVGGGQCHWRLEQPAMAGVGGGQCHWRLEQPAMAGVGGGGSVSLEVRTASHGGGGGGVSVTGGTIPYTHFHTHTCSLGGVPVRLPPTGPQVAGCLSHLPLLLRHQLSHCGPEQCPTLTTPTTAA